MAEYLKLSKAPQLVVSYPECSACEVDLEPGSDSWMCPSCGTIWSYSDDGGAEGTLYEAWSGEALDGEAVDPENAWKVILENERKRKK